MNASSIHPRKRPKQARAQATYDAILEAAARILEEGGPQQVNTNLVADVAGVSIGTLYQYFPTKEAIVSEIIRQERQCLLQDVIAATQRMDAETFEETLDTLLRAAIAHQMRRPKLARVLEYSEAGLPLDGETRGLNAAILKAVGTFLKHFEVPYAEQTAQDLVAAVRGMIDAAGLHGETNQAALFLRARKLAVGYLSQCR